MGTPFSRRRLAQATPQKPPVPRFNFTRDVVEPLAADGRYRTALAAVDEHGVIDRLTFTEVARDANRWAALLQNRLLGRGDRIIVRLAAEVAWAGVILGALKAGVVVVPCSPDDDDTVVLERALATDARLIVSREEHLSQALLEAIPDAVIPDQVKGELNALPAVHPSVDTTEEDVAFILYTAGTTNAPLGAVHTHGATAAARPDHWLGAGAEDTVWSPDTGRPIAIWDMLAAWAGGAAIVLHTHSSEVRGAARLELIERLGVTILTQTPEDYRAIIEDPEAPFVGLSTVRRALSTGATLDRELIESFRATFGVTIHDCFSQAESLVLVANLTDFEDKDGAIGFPVGDNDVAVIDAGGTECERGVEGDLAVLGEPPSLFHGYWREPEATEVALRGFWYLTGDRAVVDDDGYIWLAGRSPEADRRSAAAERSRAIEAGAAAAAAAEARALVEAEERARADEAARARAEAERQMFADRARYEAEDRARAEKEARARAAAEEQARRDAEEQARREAAAKARAEEDRARAEAEQARAQEAERARAEAQAREREEAAARAAAAAAAAAARAEEEAKVHAEAEARARARTEARARKEAEARAKAQAREEAAARAREQAEAKNRAKAEAEARRRAEAAAKAQAEADTKARRHAEAEAARARKEAEAAAKVEAAARAKAETDARARKEAEAEAARARKQAEADAKAKAIADAKAQKAAEAEAARARKQAEVDAKAKAIADAKAQKAAEAEAARARKQAEADAKAKAIADAKAQKEAEAEAARARKQAEADAKAQAAADAVARKQAEAEAKTRAEAEAKARAREEAEAKVREREEAKLRAKEEAQARKDAEAQTRAEAKARKEAEARARKQRGRRGNGAMGAPPQPEPEEEPTVELYERLRAYGRSGSEPPEEEKKAG